MARNFRIWQKFIQRLLRTKNKESDNKKDMLNKLRGITNDEPKPVKKTEVGYDLIASRGNQASM